MLLLVIVVIIGLISRPRRWFRGKDKLFIVFFLNIKRPEDAVKQKKKNKGTGT